jgi:hypothetical protein
MKGKLAPGYIGPFEVIERIGPVAYKFVLPSHLAKIHNVFHISMIRKAEIDLSRVLLQVPVEIKEDLSMEVRLVKVLDRSEKDFGIKRYQ